ncbi:MAG: polyprenyl synthetase family protein [Nocardioides sp.]
MTTSSPRWEPPGFKADLQQALDAFVADQVERLEPLGPDAAKLTDEAAALLAGGKRLRAAFCHWGYRAVSAEDPAAGSDGAALAKACAALEVLHASALVHDDLMDDSATRRGRASTHTHFANLYRAADWPERRLSSPERYGSAGAILLGDLMLSWADEMLRRCGLPADRVLAALDILDECRSEVIVGQFLDVSVQARGTADVDTAMTVLRYKSAKYSVERPLHIGAALAGADDTTLAALSDYGLPLGEAFQLRDDLLGVFGDPQATGKPAGDDLVQGKRTVLVALALDNANQAEAQLLNRSLGAEIDGAGIVRLRDIIESSGAKAQVEAAIELLTDRAVAALTKAQLTESATAALTDLATAATVRAS